MYHIGMFHRDDRQGGYKDSILWPAQVLLGLQFSSFSINTRWRLLQYVLTLFSPCGNMGGKDGTKTVVTCKILNQSKFVAVTTIELMVGCVQTEPGCKEWVIIDRSRAYASTID